MDKIKNGFKDRVKTVDFIGEMKLVRRSRNTL